MQTTVAQRRIFSHIDLRVRDRERARQFYGAIFDALGYTGSYGDDFDSFGHEPPEIPKDEQVAEWFGFTEAKEMTPGDARIALRAETREEVDRLTALLPTIGARIVEPPDDEYGPKYYAVFFEDPDGNKLELCCYG